MTMVGLTPKFRASDARLSTASSMDTRNVEVDQSYLDRLHAALAAANASSDHNYDKRGALSQRSASNGRHMRSATRIALHLSRPNYQRFRPNSPSATPPSHRLTRRLLGSGPRIRRRTKKSGASTSSGLIATWLIEAHIAGRSDRPEFAEMRDMAKDVTDSIQRGEPFRGYRDEPQKKARLQALLEELLRP